MEEAVKKNHMHAAAVDHKSKKTLAKPIGFSYHRLAQKAGRRIECQVFFLHVFLPAVDGSGLQCVSMILIRLVLVLTDLRELFVDLLYN